MLWKVLIPIIVTSLIGWGAWATITVTSSTPRKVHDAHTKDFEAHKEKDAEQFNRIQQRVEDKLDRIQELLMDRGN